MNMQGRSEIGVMVKSIKVLLIEDSPSYVVIVRSMLAEARGGDFEVECAGDLATGVARLATGGIDAVLLDLTLPDCQGLETFSKIRKEAGGIPIVVLTSLDDDTLALKTLQEGAADYLVKSEVNGNWIARSLRYAVERKRPVTPPQLKTAPAPACLEIEQTDELVIARFLEKKIVGLGTLDEIKKQLYQLVEQDLCRKLLLNFSEVEYISNAAIGILVALYKKARTADSALLFCNVSPAVYDHLSTRKLHKMFDIRQEDESALR